MSDSLIDPEFMPFSREQLEARFAFVDRRQSADPVARFVKSAARYRAHLEESGDATSYRSVRHARQIEKDETFWTATTLMRLYEDSSRATLFERLFAKAIGGDPSSIGFESWSDALHGPLELYFEVGLSSPRVYREWLRDHLAKRNLVRHVIEAGRGRTNLEGRTHLDAMLLAPETGFAAHFEAKVTSDIDTKVSYDLMRNQIARNIDAMLEPPSAAADSPLSARRADRSVLVLLTPRVVQEHPHARLYGWLMNEYRDDPDALARDLPHRRDTDWAAVSKRLGWATWEDCNEVVPGSCPWLDLLTDA